MSRNQSPVAWSTATNIYEVNIRQYTPEGTFKAFAAHLPRLKDMGVETLWFMPITPISKNGRLGTLGSYYACSDYEDTNPEFGTVEDFKLLVNDAHALGMKVIIDWVANHTGMDHVWTKTNPCFYKKNAEGNFYDTNNWTDVIDLNYYDGLMRKALIKAMQFWVETCDLDGFRCDMAHLIPLDFWQEARTALDAIKPLYWLAETEDIHYLDVFDTCYAWHWMHESENYFKGNVGLENLKNVLTRYDRDFPAATNQMFFTSNHDENSWNGTEFEKYGDAVKMLAVFNATWSGIPLLYSGQELPNHKRLKFFDKDPIEWVAQPMMHEFYQALLKFRASNAVLQAGAQAQPQWLSTNLDHSVFVYKRKLADKYVVVLLNFTEYPVNIDFSLEFISSGYKKLFSSPSIESEAKISLELGKYGFEVFYN